MSARLALPEAVLVMWASRRLGNCLDYKQGKWSFSRRPVELRGTESTVTARLDNWILHLRHKQATPRDAYASGGLGAAPGHMSAMNWGAVRSSLAGTQHINM